MGPSILEHEDVFICIIVELYLDPKQIQLFLYPQSATQTTKISMSDVCRKVVQAAQKGG